MITYMLLNMLLAAGNKPTVYIPPCYSFHNKQIFHCHMAIERGKKGNVVSRVTELLLCPAKDLKTARRLISKFDNKKIDKMCKEIEACEDDLEKQTMLIEELQKYCKQPKR